MIYLCNSAFQPLYRINVLNTVCLPYGSTNEYRYEYSGQGSHVAPSLLSLLKSAPSRKDEEVMLLFIDRFGSSGYIFHPLRTGRLIAHRFKGDQLFLNVRLLDYINPTDLPRFSDKFTKQLETQGLAKLTNNDPKNTHDGYYALSGTFVLQPDTILAQGEEAAVTAIDALSETKAFKSTKKEPLAFVRCSLGQLGKRGRRFSPKLIGEAPVFQFLRNRIYVLKLTYRFPIQRKQQSVTGQIAVNFDDTVRPLGQTVVPLDAFANSVTIPFTIKKQPEETKGKISVSAVANDPDTVLAIGPKIDLIFQVRESRLFWLGVISAIISYAVFGIVISTDIGKIQDLTVCSFISHTWPKLIAAGIQAIALFIIFRLFGKKVL